jgi:hypothetical protein
MDRAGVEHCLARLASPATSQEEARGIIAELDADAPSALPWVYLSLHAATQEADVHAAARVLAHWVHGPMGGAIEKALVTMLGDQDVGDLSKMAAAGLLESMGRPLDDDTLVRGLRDPAAAGRHALLAALGAARRPAALVRLVETVTAQPAAVALSLIDDLVRMGDPRSGRLLGPLTHSADAEVAVSAVAAADLLGMADCWPLLALAADHHPSPDVRRQAARTAARLRRAWPKAEWPGARSYLGRLEEGQGRVGLVGLRVGEASDDLWDGLTVAIARGGALRDYAVRECMADAAWEALVERLVQGGAALEEVAPGCMSRAFWDASGRALESGLPSRLGYLAWPQLLGVEPEPPP